MSTRTVLNSIPANTSFLESTKFIFTIPNLPFMRYFCQSIMLPGVSTSEAMQPTPFSEAWRHGDKMLYEPFTITVLIDEDVKVWEESYNWLRALTFPHEFPEYANRYLTGGQKYYDGILQFNTNSNLDNLRIKFHNIHPIQIGAIQMNTADTPDVTPTSDMTFRYDTFHFERDI